MEKCNLSGRSDCLLPDGFIKEAGKRSAKILAFANQDPLRRGQTINMLDVGRNCTTAEVCRWCQGALDKNEMQIYSEILAREEIQRSQW